ncbi:MAG: hypothetical protein M0D55_09145 [Elusimicrobiota bacterium]|nr:MAG: hypothetical protein M0D55_09145 [Elusimicrobiota bacterium]
MSRKTDIEALIELNGPAAELAKRAAKHPSDAQDGTVPLAPARVAKVLERFLAGELSAGDVTLWAKALASREDIAAPNDKDGKLDALLQELAGAEPSPASAKKLLERVSALP